MDIIFFVKRWRMEEDMLIKQEALSLLEPGPVHLLVDTEHNLAFTANYVRNKE